MFFQPFYSNCLIYASGYNITIPQICIGRNFRKTLSLLRLRSGAKFEKTSLSTGVCDVFYSFWTPVFLRIAGVGVGAALDAGDVYKKF